MPPIVKTYIEFYRQVPPRAQSAPGRRDWIIGSAVAVFVVGQIVHAVTDPLGCEKTHHDEPRGIYSVVTSTGNLTVVGSGTLNTTIIPAAGTIVARSRSGVAPTVQST